MCVSECFTRVESHPARALCLASLPPHTLEVYPGRGGHQGFRPPCGLAAVRPLAGPVHVSASVLTTCA